MATYDSPVTTTTSDRQLDADVHTDARTETRTETRNPGGYTPVLEHQRRDVPANYGTPRGSRISWGAILAGAIVASTLTALLTLLGVGIGLISTDAFTTADNFAIASAIWYVIAGTIALFIGGWIAARLANSRDRTDGLLHGLTTWGVSTLIAAYIASTVLGSLLGGVFGMANSALQATGTATAGLASATGSVASSALGATGNVAAAGLSAAGEAVPENVDLPSIDIPGIDTEALTSALSTAATGATDLLNEAGIQPGQRLEQAQDAPIQSAEAFIANIREYIQTPTAEKKTDLVNFVADNSDLTKAEINTRIDQIQSGYAKVEQEASDALAAAKSQATET